MEEIDVNQFESLMEKTIQQLRSDEETIQFAEYFTSNYATRKEQWANCYRKQSFINTNMYVEAFQRVFKQNNQ